RGGMSVASVAARRAAPRSHARRRHRSPVLALARAEGRRLVRHPILLASIPFCAGTFVLVTWNHAPVLSRDDILMGLALLPFAGALARWWRAALAGPVGVVALAAMEIFLVWQTSAGRPENDPNPVRWLAPWVPIAVSGDPPRELVIRPSGWHLVFIVSVALLL